jgi:Rieske Fe-S protein
MEEPYDKLEKGHGGVFDGKDGERIAAYRDAGGELHAFDAECTHQACEVEWSGDISSWECPCHGSRFNAEDGSVQNGPATEPLTRKRT